MNGKKYKLGAKEWAVIAILGVAILLAAYKSMNVPEVAEVTETPETIFGISQNDTVEIMSDRFTPSVLTVYTGTRVTWINKDTSPHRPASAPYPTSTFYPGSDAKKCGTSEQYQTFDSCSDLEPGQSWSFVFDHKGKWYYQDNLHPSIAGIIIVLEPIKQPLK